MISDRCHAWAYSFLDEAAAEAREASRRYWAKGGHADRNHPQQQPSFWPEAPGKIPAGDLADRRHRRQAR